MGLLVSIIDYGVGNVLSIARAVSAAGGRAVLIKTAQEISGADRLLLPGVGAFGHCANNLRRHGLEQAIKDFAHSGRPFLGICVGMQLMLDESAEFGRHPGLGLIPGRVERIPNLGADGLIHKVPYVGWNQLLRPKSRHSWQGTVLEKLREGDWAYFTHSYAAMPIDESHILSESDYFGFRRTTAISRDNLYGCQFHPEKSGSVGLEIISRFLTM